MFYTQHTFLRSPNAGWPTEGWPAVRCVLPAVAVGRWTTVLVRTRFFPASFPRPEVAGHLILCAWHLEGHQKTNQPVRGPERRNGLESGAIFMCA